MLHVYVSDLQRPLPEGILVTTPPGYMLRVPTGPSISPTSSARTRGCEALQLPTLVSERRVPRASLRPAHMCQGETRIPSVCSKIDEGQL